MPWYRVVCFLGIDISLIAMLFPCYRVVCFRVIDTALIAVLFPYYRVVCFRGIDTSIVAVLFSFCKVDCFRGIDTSLTQAHSCVISLLSRRLFPWIDASLIAVLLSWYKFGRLFPWY